MRFILAIDLGNDTMRYCAQVALALRKAADKLAEYPVTRIDTVDPGFAIRDQNEAPVGKWEITDAAPPTPDPLANPSNRETIKAALRLFQAEFEDCEHMDIYERFPDLFPGFHGKCAQPLSSDDIDTLIEFLPALEPTPHEANPPRRCPHVPADPNAAETPCELCGAAIFPDPKTGLWYRQDGADLPQDDEPEQCEHETVTWEPVEMDYGGDGTAEIWQWGQCEGCNQRVQMFYSQDQPHTMTE